LAFNFRDINKLKRQLIFPGSFDKRDFSELEAIYKAETKLQLTAASGQKIGAVLVPSLASTTKYLLFFYGNGMHLCISAHLFNYFEDFSAKVLMPDYVGYGVSEGMPSERGCYETADAAYNYLTQELKVAPNQIIVGGWSLGGAVAIDLAARQKLAGLVVFSTFTNLLDEAKLIAPTIPRQIIGLAVWERFASENKIGKIKCPIFIAHGTRDEAVPFWMGEKLASLAKNSSDVRFEPIPNGNHNAVFEMGGKKLKDQLQTFLAECWGSKLGI
jgi:uncharacterized protein